MKLLRSMAISRASLLRRKGRTLLALAGTAAGIACVIAMAAVGAGAQGEVTRQIDEMGTDLLLVTAGRISTFAGRQQIIGQVSTLKLSDCDAIRNNCPSVKAVAPSQQKTLKVKHGNTLTRAKTVGTTADFLHIRHFRLRSGRVFTDEDIKARLRIAVVGSQVQSLLFGGMSPVGEMIRIENIPFQIIGVLQPRGMSGGGADEDNQVFIPITTALRRVFNQTSLGLMYIQGEKNDLRRTEREVAALLRERHRLGGTRRRSDDFTIQNQINVLKADATTAASFNLLIAGAGAIAFLVGGAGILALMLLSTRERVREIGVRLAVGARPRDIVTQFLLEGLMLGVGGGLAGVLLGVVISWGANAATAWKADVQPWVILLSFLGSAAIGLAASIFPAIRASRLRPLEALQVD